MLNISINVGYYWDPHSWISFDPTPHLRSCDTKWPCYKGKILSIEIPELWWRAPTREIIEGSF